MTEKKVLIRVLQQLIDKQKDKQEIEKINDQTKENEIGNLVSDDELQEEKPVDDPLVSDSDEEIQTPLCSKYIYILQSSLHSLQIRQRRTKRRMYVNSLSEQLIFNLQLQKAFPHSH